MGREKNDPSGGKINAWAFFRPLAFMRGSEGVERPTEGKGLQLPQEQGT
tara:strand:- start:1769 stop:1915 length:147 start_codon:yes stop_codon:yes gene_type:complete